MMRFGDIYPDSWELSDKFQDATLVKNRLWKIYDRGRKIWIQTHPNSEFVHSYICTDQTVQYLCSNCSFNGRYSRAKLAELPSGEDGLFEYQEHFRKCRLPMVLFAENEKTSNVKTNESASSVFNSMLNSENLHTSLNFEAFGLNSKAFDNVSTPESSGTRWGNVSDQENDDSWLEKLGLELTRTYNHSTTSDVKKFTDDLVNNQMSLPKSTKNSNLKTYRCERKNSRRSTSIEETNSCTDIQSPNSSERTITPLKYSEVVPISIVDKQFADAVEVDRKWGYLNDLKIWVEVPGKTGKVYLYKTKKTELKCKKCRIGRRYSKVEVFKNSDGFQHLFEVSNHQKECEYDVKTLKRLYEVFIEANVKKQLSVSMANGNSGCVQLCDSVSVVDLTEDEPLGQSLKASTSYSGCDDGHNSVQNLSESMKTKNRTWNLSEDWNIKPTIQENVPSNNSIVFADLTRDETPVENFENPRIFNWSRTPTGNALNVENSLKYNNEVIKKKRCQSVLVDDCWDKLGIGAKFGGSSDVEHILSENDRQNLVLTRPLKTQTYGDVYKISAHFTRLANAIKITERKWELSNNGRRVWCQSKSDPNLWYFYSRERNNRFKCYACTVKKRVSLVKVIVEADGSKSLWAVENHEENCLREYGMLFVNGKSANDYTKKRKQIIGNDSSEIRSPAESDVRKRRCQSVLVDSRNEKHVSSFADSKEFSDMIERQYFVATTSSLELRTYGNYYGSDARMKYLSNALKLTDRTWKLTDNEKRIWCQSKSDPDLWYMYGRVQKNMNRFMCNLCLVRKRYSSVRLVVEADGSKSLWAVENHEESCLREYGQLFNGRRKSVIASTRKRTQTIGNDFSEIKVPVKNGVRKRCQSMLHNEEVKFKKRRLSTTVLRSSLPTSKSDSCEILSINGDSQADKQNVPVSITLKLVKYGDVYKTSLKFAKASKVIGRTWKMSGNILWCQSELNSKLWYLYHLQLNERFRCYECCNSKRYSSVKYVIEKDGSKTLWSVENHGKECLKNYEEIREHLKKNNSIIRNFTTKQKIPNDSLKNPGSSKLKKERKLVKTDSTLKTERKTIDCVNDENFDLPSLNSPEEPTLSSESTTPNQSGSKTSLKNVKPRPIIFLANENIYLPENLWILPCTSKNIAKKYLFIVSKRNSNFGSKLVLRGTFEATLIYCCSNCQNSESEVAAIVRFENGRIFVKLEENANHQNRCYKMDLRKTLSNEGKILVNKKN